MYAWSFHCQKFQMQIILQRSLQLYQLSINVQFAALGHRACSQADFSLIERTITVLILESTRPGKVMGKADLSLIERSDPQC